LNVELERSNLKCEVKEESERDEVRERARSEEMVGQILRRLTRRTEDVDARNALLVSFLRKKNRA